MEKNEILEAVKILTEKKEVITLEELSKELNCCVRTLRKYISKYNLYKDMPDCFLRVLSKRNSFNSLNRENSFWIGYITADGCISFSNPKQRSSRLLLECKIDDKEILENFCKFIKVRESRITLGHQGKSCCFSLSNSDFEVSIEEYGIEPNKSSKEINIDKRILTNDAFFYPYLRGLIVGDGTIHTSKNSIGVSIVSTSYNLLYQIKTKLEESLPYPTSLWLMVKEKKNKLPLYTLKIGTGQNRENLHYLYSQFYQSNQDKIILNRKYQKFISIL